jgi:uncharacterized OB-fold protein
MNGKLITLACLLIASLAVAQTANKPRTGSSEQGTDSGTKNKGASLESATEVVAVNNFSPGNSIVVSSTPDTHPTTYKLGKDVEIVDESGKKIDPDQVRPGTRVRLQVAGNDRHIGRIMVIGPGGGI